MAFIKCYNKIEKMLSRIFLLKNRECCGEGCLMCPYFPKNKRKSKIINQNILPLCSNEELDIIDKLFN